MIGTFSYIGTNLNPSQTYILEIIVGLLMFSSVIVIGFIALYLIENLLDRLKNNSTIHNDSRDSSFYKISNRK